MIATIDFLSILDAILVKAWVVPTAIVSLQAVVVVCSFVRIRWKRRHRSEPLSTRLPGPLVGFLHRWISARRSALMSQLHKWLLPSNRTAKEQAASPADHSTGGFTTNGSPLEPRIDADGRYYGPFPLLSAILRPRIAYVLTGMAVASSITLYFLDNVLSGLVVEVSYEHLFYLNVLTVFFAVFQTVAFWQLDSDLLWHYRELDKKWQRPGLTHKIYLSEALGRVRQTAGIIAEKCELDGEDRIHDIHGDARSVDYKEEYTRGLLEVVHTYTDRFYQLDKDPECYELVIENLFIRIGQRTVAPLARALCDINTKGGSGSEEWFPVDYAALVWQSSLALAAKLETSPSATSIVDFRQFREHYEKAVHQHPKTSAKRIFIIGSSYRWQEELLTELNAIADAGQEAKGLPKLQDTVTHLQWIQGVHNSIKWKVKFMSEGQARQIRLRHASGDLPKYLDFLLVPAKNGWSVRFACDLNRSTTLDNFMLDVSCCPLKVDYIRSNDSQAYFDEMWSEARPAADWLTHAVTLEALMNHPAYTPMHDGIMSL